mgnify:CR=1 FL=1
MSENYCFMVVFIKDCDLIKCNFITRSNNLIKKYTHPLKMYYFCI